MCEFDADGLNINFFESPRLEQQQPSDPQENARIIARNMLRLLMMKYEGHASEMLSSQLLQAVLIKSDPALLLGMRHAFREGFKHIGTQLIDTELSPRQNNQAKFFISNCLCIFPFSDLRPDDCYQIPQFIHQKWVLVEYKITPIELTPTRGIQTLFIHDQDRVFAYGLEPVGNDAAGSHLIFMGTTYPAGQGFITQLNTDLEGFETVGNSLYRTGRERITAWLDKQNKNTHVCGTSLGGALALLLALDQGEKLSRVDALNPPGLYDAWIKSDLDRWDDLKQKPDVYIQKQGDDFVSSLGVWKKDWHVLHLRPATPASNSIFDHAQNYAGHADTVFKAVDVDEDNEARRMRNLLLYSLARGVVYYVGVLPYYYLIRPVLLYAYEYKTPLMLLGLVFACLIPFISFNAALFTVVTPIVLHVVSKFVISSDIWMGFKDRPVANIHEVIDEACKEEEKHENNALNG